MAGGHGGHEAGAGNGHAFGNLHQLLLCGPQLLWAPMQRWAQSALTVQQLSIHGGPTGIRIPTNEEPDTTCPWLTIGPSFGMRSQSVVRSVKDVLPGCWKNWMCSTVPFTSFFGSELQCP